MKRAIASNLEKPNPKNGQKENHLPVGEAGTRVGRGESSDQAEIVEREKLQISSSMRSEFAQLAGDQADRPHSDGTISQAPLLNAGSRATRPPVAPAKRPAMAPSRIVVSKERSPAKKSCLRAKPDPHPERQLDSNPRGNGQPENKVESVERAVFAEQQRLELDPTDKARSNRRGNAELHQQVDQNQARYSMDPWRCDLKECSTSVRWREADLLDQGAIALVRNAGSRRPARPAGTRSRECVLDKQLPRTSVSPLCLRETRIGPRYRRTKHTS